MAGRPAKPPAERKTARVVFYVTPTEADYLYTYAIRRGVPLTHVLHAAVRPILRQFLTTEKPAPVCPPLQ